MMMMTMMMIKAFMQCCMVQKMQRYCIKAASCMYWIVVKLQGMSAKAIVLVKKFYVVFYFVCVLASSIFEGVCVK